jgi:hypothetical protein
MLSRKDGAVKKKGHSVPPAEALFYVYDLKDIYV